MNEKKRILTGDRPTGHLHLGHYIGTLQNRVRLQDDYECFFIIADLQVLTDHLENFGTIGSTAFEVMCDYLAVGLKPTNTFFIQSQVPELAELTTYFSYLVSLARVQRNPTVKDEAKTYGVSNMSLGFVSYPVSQAADILAFKANLIPVGQDQLPHIEQTREIARTFNRTFGVEVFPLPEPLVGTVPILLGIDGANKMSKSLNNDISFAQDPAESERRILTMVTDTNRIYRKDPGNPNNCYAFKYWATFAQSSTALVSQECTTAQRGCRDCKAELAQQLNVFLEPFRERRRVIHGDPNFVWDVMSTGTRTARAFASRTLSEVREAMHLHFPKLKLRN